MLAHLLGVEPQERQPTTLTTLTGCCLLWVGLWRLQLAGVLLFLAENKIGPILVSRAFFGGAERAVEELDKRDKYSLAYSQKSPLSGQA